MFDLVDQHLFTMMRKPGNLFIDHPVSRKVSLGNNINHGMVYTLHSKVASARTRCSCHNPNLLNSNRVKLYNEQSMHKSGFQNPIGVKIIKSKSDLSTCFPCVDSEYPASITKCMLVSGTVRGLSHDRLVCPKVKWTAT